MKTQHGLLLSLVIVVMLALMLFAFNGPTALAGLLRITPAPSITPAPTATPGLPPPNPTSIPLSQPIATKEQALKQVLYYDAIWSVWAESWSIDTLTADPNRITVEEYASRTEENATRGFGAVFSPEIETDAGGVWSITINGDVHVEVPSPRETDSNAIYDGVTYVISRRTGNLLEIRPGPIKSK